MVVLRGLIAALIVCIPTVAHSDAVSEFYVGKRVTITVGQTAGGGFDAYARLVGRHLGRHIPGQPAVLVENRPGGGGITNANYLHGVAPRDGTVLGMINHNSALQQLLGSRGVRYDAREFNWVGRVASTPNIQYTWHTSPVKTLRDALQTEVVVAAVGISNASFVYPTLMNRLIGTKFKVITGFTGTSVAGLAMQRGEVEGMLNPWASVKAANPDWIRDRKINILVQFGLSKNPEIPEAPLVFDFAKDEEQTQIWTFLVRADEIGRSIAAPPALPSDRLSALRGAFMAMIKDKEFIRDAEKVRIEPSPLHGDRLQKLFSGFFTISPALVEKIRTSVPEIQ